MPEPAGDGSRRTARREAVSRIVERMGQRSGAADRALPKIKRAGLVKRPAPQDAETLVGSVNARARRLLPAPVLRKNREERLIQMLPVLLERLPQQTFLHRADLHQRAVAAAVLHGGPRLEATDADRVEGELEHQFRAGFEHARAPEVRADGETPLRRVEPRAEIAHLEDADGRVVALHRHGEARVLAGLALAVRPRDE